MTIKAYGYSRCRENGTETHSFKSFNAPWIGSWRKNHEQRICSVYSSQNQGFEATLPISHPTNGHFLGLPKARLPPPSICIPFRPSRACAAPWRRGASREPCGAWPTVLTLGAKGGVKVVWAEKKTDNSTEMQREWPQTSWRFCGDGIYFFLEMRKRSVLSQMVVMAFHILAVWKCECASLQGS